MIRKGVYLFAIFALLTIAIAKPSGPSPWSSYAEKPVYARALGPPMSAGIGSISVPYKPKSSPFFPKFVDPSMMISKKTDMLSNFFGGPPNYPGTLATGNSGFYSSTKPISYTDESSKNINDLEEIFGVKSSSPIKRGIFGPVGPKVGPFGPKFVPGSLPFTPFGPFGSKFGPFDGSDISGSSEIPKNSIDSRRKRSIADTPSGTPPPYPDLGPIPEESEDDVAGIPKFYFPGMFGPFGSFKPISPFAASPVVDPTIFISKKKSFLDSLFKTLATSTTPAPAPAVVDTVTDTPIIKPTDFWSSFETVTGTPVAKSTIVPPGYWTPSAIIPGPLEYSNKVSDFLDKLFDSLKLNKTSVSPKIARSLTSDSEYPTTKVSRSVDDFTTISAAKDAIVDSIIDELGSLKTDMFNTMNDFIAAQTTPSPSPSPFPLKPGKPIKPGKVGKPVKPTSPFKAAFSSMWAPQPPVDTTLPFKQKMTVLSQVFDMLTGLQKNITLAIQDSIVKSTATDPSTASDDFNAVENLASSTDISAQLNSTLLDAIKNKLDSLDAPAPVNPYYVGSKYARALSPSSENRTPFLTNSPGATEKRQADYDDDNDDDEVYENEKYQHNQNNNHDQFKRGVKMAMRQGYQSMPPGTIESVQAGGGSVPGHQGGGIKLLIKMPTYSQASQNDQQENNNYDDYANKWSDWAEYMKYQNQGRRNNHHHNRH